MVRWKQAKYYFICMQKGLKKTGNNIVVIIVFVNKVNCYCDNNISRQHVDLKMIFKFPLP